VRSTFPTLVLACFLTSLLAPAGSAQEKSEGPTDPKARKTYEKALKYLHEHNTQSAFDEFKKADKQDSGRCVDCQIKMISYGAQLAEWKTAELAAAELLAEAKSDRDTAIAHYQSAFVLVEEGLQKAQKMNCSPALTKRVPKLLLAFANFPDALWLDWHRTRAFKAG